MSFFMIFRVALKALGRNKMRTALTMLGMIIGVGAVIIVVAIGRGAEEQITASVQAGGTNLITISAGNWNRGGVSHGMGSSPRLKAVDVEAIREQVPGAQYLTASVNTRDQVIAAGENWQTRIEGTDVELPLIRFWDVELGTFFTSTDVSSAAKVAVLGSVVRDNLFGEGSDPVGQTIRVRNQSFKIIGVMTAKGSGSFGQDQDDTLFAPYTTVQRKLRGRDGTNISRIMISARSADEIAGTTAQIEEVLRAQHELIQGEENDFMVRTQDEMMSMLTSTTGTMTTLIIGDRRGVTDRRRHRHHEHHAGVGDRAHPGNRTADGGWRQGPGRVVAIPRGSRRPQPRGRLDRRRNGLRRLPRAGTFPSSSRGRPVCRRSGSVSRSGSPA